MTTGSRVQKFRSIEEMNAAPVNTPPGADVERFLRHCARYWALAPRTYPRGVFKFRSIDDVERAAHTARPTSVSKVQDDFQRRGR